MAIFTHVTVGVDDITKAREFYDAVLEPLGYKRLFNTDDRSGYGATAPEFMIVRPLDGKKATSGNGSTIGLSAANRASVDAFHKQALARGGKCEGPPGTRPGMPPNFYAAYIRDSAGNKLTAITMAE